MKITLSRKAVYVLRDKLDEVLNVDGNSHLELYSVDVATEGSAEDYPYDEVALYPHFSEVELKKSV